LILRVAAGHGDAIPENIESNIREISEKVKIHDGDGDDFFASWGVPGFSG
jgi:hypothetical protein